MLVVALLFACAVPAQERQLGEITVLSFFDAHRVPDTLSLEEKWLWFAGFLAGRHTRTGPAPLTECLRKAAALVRERPGVAPEEMDTMRALAERGDMAPLAATIRRCALVLCGAICG